MKHISEILPSLKDLASIGNPLEVFRTAEECLPSNCFWRQGKMIHLGMLVFIGMQLREKVELSAEAICFYCSVQYTQNYEDCSGKLFPSEYFH